MAKTEQQEKLIAIIHTVAAYVGAGASQDDEWWKEARQLILPTLEALRLHAECNWSAFENIWIEQLERFKLRHSNRNVPETNG